ncbi:YjaG family protein [Hymenobacter weizhouensis]|uniref:YjaG family protein n=1 Tax=Hymenobacter sp. YIM 151500-1 TaxID=2987689 RepID=UPI00222776AC|nr:YjaG family protein [Hymenobacter sp. YIM 151500-1]UYZ61506.1 YjaG family protein [Hymenobacter sp. YIM 151500-1]
MSTLISALPFQHQVLLAALTCEKILPLYAAFTEAESWGSFGVLQQATSALFDFAINDTLIDTDAIQGKLAAVVPDLDECSSELASYALDACTALSEALLFIETRSYTYLQQHLTAVTDCIDMFVQMHRDLDPNQPDLDVIITADPYMQQELTRRETLVVALHQVPTLTSELLEHLRQLNGTEPLVRLEMLPLS